MQLRTHKGLSEIEQDIRLYYDNGTVDALLTALQIAGRALAIAQPLADAFDRPAVIAAKQQVFALIHDRQCELNEVARGEQP